MHLNISFLHQLWWSAAMSASLERKRKDSNQRFVNELILDSRWYHVDSIQFFNSWPLYAFVGLLEEMCLGDDADLHSADSSRAKGSIHRGFALARRHRRSWATVALGSAAHHFAQRHLWGSRDQNLPECFGTLVLISDISSDLDPILEYFGFMWSCFSSFHLVFSNFSSFQLISPYFSSFHLVSSRLILFHLAWSRLISHYLDLSWFILLHLIPSQFISASLFHLISSGLILLHPVSSRYLLWSRFISVALTSSRLINLASSRFISFISLFVSLSLSLSLDVFSHHFVSFHLI